MEAMNDTASARTIGSLPSLHASSLQLLKRGASGAFLVTVGGTGLSFLANLVMARVIGRHEFGVYALMFSWVSVLAVIAQAGQDISMIRLLPRSEEHTSELQSIMRISYAVFCLKKKKNKDRAN